MPKSCSILNLIFKGIVTGGLFTLGKHNNFYFNHQRWVIIYFIFVVYHKLKKTKVRILNRAALFIAVLNALTGILAGFAIFSVLGYMSNKTGIPVPNLAVGGPGLSFIGILSRNYCLTH